MAAAKGNTYASKTERLWANMINRKVKQDPDRLERIALKVLDAAEAGEPWAVTEVRNTLDGKPVQQVEHSGGMSLTQTVRDLSDDELLRIATQQTQDPDTDGHRVQ